MYGVANDLGVYFAKTGYYKGKKVTITHRDPATGNVWLDDYQVKKGEYGCWVKSDSVKYEGDAV